MGASKTKDNEAVAKVSNTDQRILLLGMACYEEMPKVDFEKLAAISGYTVRSAQITYGRARRILLDAVNTTSPNDATATQGAPTTPTTTPKPTTPKPTTPKRKAPAGGAKPRRKRAKKGESNESGPDVAGGSSQGADAATDGTGTA